MLLEMMNSTSPNEPTNWWTTWVPFLVRHLAKTGRANLQWSNVVDPSKTEANGNGNGEAAKATTAAEGAEPEQKETDPAVNGTGEGEGAGEKTEAEPTTA
jgi:hypothetical protein